MTGLLADPLTDPAGLGAVRADLASVVPQVLEPARVSLRISHCDRDWLTRTAAGASDHRLMVASIVSRRTGRWSLWHAALGSSRATMLPLGSGQDGFIGDPAPIQ